MPEISIIMSVFNGQVTFLKQSIESVLNQSFFDLEFIIVDDGVKKNVREIIKKYASSDKRIRIIKNENNLGLTKSLNIAIKEAKGKFIARMDDDDISLPSRIVDQLNYLKLKNLDFLGCDCDFIDEDNKKIKEKRIIFPNNLKQKLFKGNFFTHSTFFGKNEVFKEFYNEKFKKAQDYEFLLRITNKNFRIGYLNKTLLLYRVNNESISIKNAKEQELYALKARWEAICKYNYNKFYSIYFIRAFLSFLIPYKIKHFIIYRIIK